MDKERELKEIKEIAKKPVFPTIPSIAEIKINPDIDSYKIYTEGDV